MSNTTPNKETIRRFCLLFRVSYCYLLTDTKTEYANLFLDISNKKKDELLHELESWCGMKFKLLNLTSNEDEITQVKTRGERIYPL